MKNISEKQLSKIKNINVFTILVLIHFIGIFLLGFTRITGIPTYWPSVLLLILYSLFFNPKIFVKPTIIMSLLLFLVLSIYKYCGHLNNLPDIFLYPFGDFSLVFHYLFVGLILENLIIYNDKRHIVSKISKLFIAIIVINSVVTIIGEYIHPGITRNLNRDNVSEWLSPHTFGAIYGIPYILAVLIGVYKGNLRRVMILTGILLSSLLISGFLNSLFISFIAILLAIQFRYFQNKNIILVLAVILIIYTYSVDNFTDFLNILPNKNFQSKAELFRTEYSNKSITELIINLRFGVYYRSIQSFLDNIWFGVGSYARVGGHSYILDKLGMIGIFGTATYFITLIQLYKRALFLISVKFRKLYTNLLFLLFIQLVLNPFEIYDFWILYFICIPVLINYYSEDQKNTNETELPT